MTKETEGIWLNRYSAEVGYFVGEQYWKKGAPHQTNPMRCLLS